MIKILSICHLQNHSWPNREMTSKTSSLLKRRSRFSIRFVRALKKFEIKSHISPSKDLTLESLVPSMPWRVWSLYSRDGYLKWAENPTPKAISQLMSWNNTSRTKVSSWRSLKIFNFTAKMEWSLTKISKEWNLLSRNIKKDMSGHWGFRTVTKDTFINRIVLWNS